MYGRKTPSTYRSTPSVYSHYTGKSSTNLRSSKSLRSLRVPWYQKPILHDAIVLDLQRGSLLTGFLSLVVALFTFSQSIFDIYCLYMAAPGSSHTGYYVISYQFVYVGSPPIRNVLIVFALFSWIGSVAVLLTSIVLINALRKEYEKRIVPWLYTFGVFILFRFIAFLFFAIVNDLIFSYNVLTVLIWSIVCVFGCYGWLLVYSLYLELSDLTKLEDLAHLRRRCKNDKQNPTTEIVSTSSMTTGREQPEKEFDMDDHGNKIMGTMQSLNASLAGSRPTTPHSTVSTMPASQI